METSKIKKGKGRTTYFFFFNLNFGLHQNHKNVS